MKGMLAVEVVHRFPDQGPGHTELGIGPGAKATSFCATDFRVC